MAEVTAATAPDEARSSLVSSPFSCDGRQIFSGEGVQGAGGSHLLVVPGEVANQLTAMVGNQDRARGSFAEYVEHAGEVSVVAKDIEAVSLLHATGMIVSLPHNEKASARERCDDSLCHSLPGWGA